MLHGLPWLCCMGYCGYVAWVAVVMLHGLPWLCCMGCRGYVAWVAMVMLYGLPWLCCMGCHGYVALPPEVYILQVVRIFYPGAIFWVRIFYHKFRIFRALTLCSQFFCAPSTRIYPFSQVFARLPRAFTHFYNFPRAFGTHLPILSQVFARLCRAFTSGTNILP